MTKQAAAALASTAFLYYESMRKIRDHLFTADSADFLAARERSKEVLGR